MIPLPFIDVHSHLIPAVDDGARNAFDAREALAVLASDGVRRVVATPHVQASILADMAARARRMTELDMGWQLLRNVREELPEDAPLLDRGIELLLDAPEPDLSDPRLRLAGGSAVLVEFPFLRIPMYAERQLGGMLEAGWVPVVAHVERYAEIGRSLGQIARWREMGAVLQVNAGSLLGRHGPRARRRARHLLASGWVSLLASDYHARGGPPSLRQARDRLLRQTRATGEGAREGDARRQGGENGGYTGVRGAARLLLGENPGRLLEGGHVLPVPPLARRPVWNRWLGGGS